MKKKVLTALFCILSFVLLLASKPISIRAFAANDFEVAVQQIEIPFSINNTSIYAGDLKVTISITNNTGFSLLSFNMPFETNSLSGVCHNNSLLNPVTIAEEVLIGQSYACSYANNGFGIAFTTMETITQNGKLVSFFLRPNPNVSTEPEDIVDLISPINVQMMETNQMEPVSYTEPEEFEYTVAIPYSFYLGDIDGTVSNNGYRIGLMDVQKLLQMINSYDGTLYVTATDTNFSQTDYPGLYVMINNVPTLELRVADVNFDGIIDSTDHALLLDYYVDCIIGLEPEGEIGQLQTHVTYVVQYSTGS